MYVGRGVGICRLSQNILILYLHIWRCQKKIAAVSFGSLEYLWLAFATQGSFVQLKRIISKGTHQWQFFTTQFSLNLCLFKLLATCFHIRVERSFFFSLLRLSLFWVAFIHLTVYIDVIITEWYFMVNMLIILMNFLILNFCEQFKIQFYLALFFCFTALDQSLKTYSGQKGACERWKRFDKLPKVENLLMNTVQFFSKYQLEIFVDAEKNGAKKK